MSKKAEPSFELKTIIWDLAATLGENRPTDIQRQLDIELEKRRKAGDLFEDTPDVRTISRIVKEINKLDTDIVVAKLPRHVWKLRDDYVTIEQIAEWAGQTVQSEMKEKLAMKIEVANSRAVMNTDLSNLARQHDVTIFKKSDAIMNEEDIEIGLGVVLEGQGFIDPAFRSQLEEFMIYSTWWESNKYLSPTLRDLCEIACKKMGDLDPFIHELFIEGSTHDGEGTKIYGLILKNEAPKEQIKLLKELLASCRADYRNYRIAVRQLLFL